MLTEYALLHDDTVELVSVDGYKKELSIGGATRTLNLDARKDGKSQQEWNWDSRRFEEKTPDKETHCTAGDYAYMDLFWNLVSANLFHNMYEQNGREVDPPNNIGPIGVAKVCTRYFRENDIDPEWVHDIHHWATEIYSNARGPYYTLTGDMQAESFIQELWKHPKFKLLEDEYIAYVEQNGGNYPSSTGRMFKGDDFLVLAVL